MNDHNSEASRTGGITIAYGMAKYETDVDVAAVFERADNSMYENKSKMKLENNRDTQSAPDGLR